MVQSDLQGGSLHASRAALDYQRWLAVPYPTSMDKNNSEPKIQANLLLSEGSIEEKLKLLKCTSSALKHLHILRGREDYSILTKQFADDRPIALPEQKGLL